MSSHWKRTFEVTIRIQLANLLSTFAHPPETPSYKYVILYLDPRQKFEPVCADQYIKKKKLTLSPKMNFIVVELNESDRDHGLTISSLNRIISLVSLAFLFDFLTALSRPGSSTLSSVLRRIKFR